MNISENLSFSKNFLYFRFDTVEKQSIINLCSLSSYSNSFVVLSDSEVTFLGEEKDAVYCLFLYSIFIIKK